MSKFASPDRQAASVMKALQGHTLPSVRTVANYEACLSLVAKYVQANRLGSLRDLTPDMALTWLEKRSLSVSQKTLDMERQAIQVMLQHVTRKLKTNERLKVIKSQKTTVLVSRAYTTTQIELIASVQQSHNQLSTLIAWQAGLRAHELFTLRPLSEQRPSIRPAMPEKFLGLDGMKYTVAGKGGLIREVVLPYHLAELLELRRHPEPKQVMDRGVFYKSYYDIGGGHSWSSAWTRCAKSQLGWSEGAHGLRHTYAQTRMVTLQTKHRLSREDALRAVSQEMGHFRPEITEVYLR